MKFYQEIVEDIFSNYKSSQFIVLTSGNIGCGKSTFVKELIICDFKKRLMSVDLDSIATMLHGGDYTRFDEKLFSLYGTIKSFAFDEVVSRGHSVIVDGCNFSQYARRPYTEKSRELKIPILCVNFGPGDEGALKRRIAEGRGYPGEKWEKIFNSFSKKFVKPVLEEGFSKIYEVKSGT